MKKYKLAFIPVLLVIVFSCYIIADNPEILNRSPDIHEEIIRKPGNLEIGKIQSRFRDSYIKIVPYTAIEETGEIKVDVLFESPFGSEFLATIPINDVLRDQPALWLDDINILLGYKTIYNIDTKKHTNIELPLQFFNSADLSPNKRNIAYIGKGKDDKYSVWVYSIDTNEFHYIYTIEPEEWGNTLSPIIGVSWGTDNELYFDAPVKGKPNVFKYDADAGAVVKFREDAQLPFGDYKGDYIAYLKGDDYISPSEDWHTIIENIKTGETISFPEFNKVLYGDKNISVIGRYSAVVLERYSLNKIKTMESYGEMGFPQMLNDALIFSEIIFEQGKLSSAQDRIIEP